MKKSILAKNFKKLRLFKNMSQNEFAELVGVKRSSIGAYEEGRAEPKLEVLIRMADLFKLQVDDLVRKELTVNQIARFKLPEEDKIELRSLHDKLNEISKRLSAIESKMKVKK